MKNVEHLSIVLILSTVASLSWAANTGVDHHAVRLDVSYNTLSMVADTIGDPSTDESSQEALLTFNPNSRFFAEIGFLNREIDEVKAFDQSIETGVDYTGNVIGIGYRVPRKNVQERFVGVGLRVFDLDNDADLQPNVAVRGFIERESAQRYGLIQIAYSVDSDRTLSQISGRHVWFVHPTIGAGVNWAFGAGTQDNGDLPPYTVSGYQIGVILMFKARF